MSSCSLSQGWVLISAPRLNTNRILGQRSVKSELTFFIPKTSDCHYIRAPSHSCLSGFFFIFTTKCREVKNISDSWEFAQYKCKVAQTLKYSSRTSRLYLSTVLGLLSLVTFEVSDPSKIRRLRWIKLPENTKKLILRKCVWLLITFQVKVT